MATATRVLHVMLLGIWLGASVFFIGLAPEVLAVLDSRHVAGDVITAALSLIDAYGVLAGPAILVTLFIGWLPQGVPLRNRAVGALTMTGAALLSRYYVTPELADVKAAMSVRLEHMDPTSPLMQQYDSLHTMSSVLMTLHVAVCLFMIITAMTARQKRSFGIEL